MGERLALWPTAIGTKIAGVDSVAAAQIGKVIRTPRASRRASMMRRPRHRAQRHRDAHPLPIPIALARSPGRRTPG